MGFPVCIPSGCRYGSRLLSWILSACLLAVPYSAVWAQALISVTVTPDLLSRNRIVGGNVATGTVTLDAVAPAAGAVVTLTSSKPTAAAVPATVTVAAGARQATFSITTTKQTEPVAVTITAKRGAALKTVAIRVSDDVTDYAKACYARLKIKETDFAGPFKCKNGTQLVSVVNGKTVDITLPGGAPNPDNAGAFPATCDFPTWLPNDKQCYGNSFIQELKIGGNADFQGGLLCRHKTRWEGVCAGGPNNGRACTRDANCPGGGRCMIGDKDFPDIALILYNPDNGETCWFQTPDSNCAAGEKRCDGTNVPAPHTAAAKQFYLPPFDSAKINCVRCHDNGPWMNSRWIDNVTKALKDNPAGPYLNNGTHFDKWAKTTFVTVKRDGLPKEGRSCTSCHKMHAKEITPDPTPAFSGTFGRDYLTMLHWLDYSVGIDFPPESNARGRQLDQDHALWMPPNHGLANADWQKIYKAHIDALRACMEKKGIETEENKKKGSNCAVRPVAPTNPAPAGRGARLRGRVSDGTELVKEASENGFFAETPHPISPGTSVTLSWEADSNYHACAIEATLPAGLEPVPANAGGWNLQDPPQHLGPFSAPGQYRFDMYCEFEHSANFILEIAGTPPPLLQIQAIVNTFGGPMATNVPGPSQTRANGRRVDPIFIYWSSSNVQDDCVVDELLESARQPTGTQFSGGSGLVPITLAGTADQTYRLMCTGRDGVSRVVETTIRPIAGTLCDVNEDGVINRTDVDAIFAGRNFAAVPNDLRDVDGDLLVTVNDARICVNRCAKRLCAP